MVVPVAVAVKHVRHLAPCVWWCTLVLPDCLQERQPADVAQCMRCCTAVSFWPHEATVTRVSCAAVCAQINVPCSFTTTFLLTTLPSLYTELLATGIQCDSSVLHKHPAMRHTSIMHTVTKGDSHTCVGCSLKQNSRRQKKAPAAPHLTPQNTKNTDTLSDQHIDTIE